MLSVANKYRKKQLTLMFTLSLQSASKSLIALQVQIFIFNSYKSLGECSIQSIGENEDSVVHKTAISEKLESLFLKIEVVCRLEVLIYLAFTVQCKC